MGTFFCPGTPAGEKQSRAVGQKRNFTKSCPKLVPPMPALCRMSAAWANPGEMGRRSQGSCWWGLHGRDVWGRDVSPVWGGRWGRRCLFGAVLHCPSHKHRQGMLQCARGDGAPTSHCPVGDLAASNIFFLPSIPDMASTFLRQSPTSTGRSCRGERGQGLVGGQPAAPHRPTPRHGALLGVSSCPAANPHAPWVWGWPGALGAHGYLPKTWLSCTVRHENPRKSLWEEEASTWD